LFVQYRYFLRHRIIRIFGLVDMKVLQFTSDGFCLVAFPGTKRAGIHLDQSNNIRMDRLDEFNDLFQITVGVFKIPAVWNRKVKLPPDSCCISYVVQKKSHIFGFDIPESYLKIRIFGRNQDEAENQPTGILKYVEDLIRGLNADIGRKDFFEMISSAPLL